VGFALSIKETMKNNKIKKQKKEIQDTNTFEPDWLYDKPSDSNKPYTDEEIELFVESFIDAHCDTQAWKEAVRKLGKEEARQQLRDGFRNKDTRKNRKIPSLQ
jgi:hypothetical protein